MVGFGRTGACEAVVSISEETLDHRGGVSLGMNQTGEKKYSVLGNAERKVSFSLVL